jgi:hypothetical protein
VNSEKLIPKSRRDDRILVVIHELSSLKNEDMAHL